MDSAPKVDLFHIPIPSTPLIGRTQELSQLTQAFENPKTRLATIIAPGGIGKSALTDAWLKELQKTNYSGVQASLANAGKACTPAIKYVFAWSFYSQGQHQTYTNSSAFFQAVLLILESKT